MTTQRDRLAVIVGEAALAEMERQGASENFTWSNVADALIARGVRVVDGTTLAQAVHNVIGSPFDLVLETMDVGNAGTATSCGDIADAILTALDAEP